MKKQILLNSALAATAALMVLGSCSRDIIIDERGGEPVSDLIGFHTNANKTQTRVGVATLDTLKENGFRVTALQTGGYSLSEVLNNQEVTYDKTALKWAYSPLQPWPETKVDFFAFSPAQSANVTNNTGTPPSGIELSTDKSALTLEYTVPATKQEDFMIAVHKSAAKTEGAVKLSFQHALSRIVIKAKKANPADKDIYIKGVSLLNLSVKGTLDLLSTNIPQTNTNFAYANNGTYTNTTIWKPTSSAAEIAAAEYRYDMKKAELLKENEAADLTHVIAGADSAFVILPQTTKLGSDGNKTDDDKGFYICLETADSDEATATVSKAFYYVPDIYGKAAAGSGMTFEPGRQYTITLRVNGEQMISFDDVDVNTWDEDNSNGDLEVELNAKDLSFSKTANSYIVNDPGVLYKFKATVQGNGVTAKQGDYTPWNMTDTLINKKTGAVRGDAIVVWSTGGAVTTTAGAKPGDPDVVTQKIDGVVYDVKLGKDGYIYFKTSSNEFNGNALIAVRDQHKNILWSWHIWKMKNAVDVNSDATYDTYIAADGVTKTKVMKWNLGATYMDIPSADKDAAPYQMGLLYQFGRKEPFVGVADWTGTLPTTAQRIDNAATPYKATRLTTQTTVSLKDAIANPNTWYHGTKGSFAHWINPMNYSYWALTADKSIFDPCPAGWRVPAGNDFSVFASAGNALNGTWGTYGATIHIGASNTTFVPATGYYEYDGTYVNTKTNAMLWSRDNSSDKNGMAWTLTKTTATNLRTETAGSVPVRCVAE